MMVDHGILSWTRRAEKSEGSDGSEKAPDPCIRGLIHSRGATPWPGRALHSSSRSCVSFLAHGGNTLKS